MTPNLDRQLADLHAILKASPGYGRRHVSQIVADEVEGDDCEPSADELRRTERPWGL